MKLFVFALILIGCVAFFDGATAIVAAPSSSVVSSLPIPIPSSGGSCGPGKDCPWSPTNQPKGGSVPPANTGSNGSCSCGSCCSCGQANNNNGLILPLLLSRIGSENGGQKSGGSSGSGVDGLLEKLIASLLGSRQNGQSGLLNVLLAGLFGKKGWCWKIGAIQNTSVGNVLSVCTALSMST